MSSQPGDLRASGAAGRSRRGRIHIVVGVVVAVVTIAPAYYLVHNQRQSRYKAEAEFRSRVPAAAGFVSGYLKSLASAQRAQAVRYLNGPMHECDPVGPSAASPFVELVNVIGVRESSVFDAGGNVLALYPCDASVLVQLKARAVTVMGGADTTVSNLQMQAGSSSGAVPTVDIATRFSFLGQSRLLVGGYSTAATPLAAFLRGAVPEVRDAAYLVDGSGAILASSRIAPVTTPDISIVDPPLAKAMVAGKSGVFGTVGGVAYYFTTQPISGSAWKLVMVAPQSVLFSQSGAQGREIVVQWAAFAVFVLAVAVAISLFYRYLAGRDQLAALSMELDLVSRLDQLTGLYNRRHLDDHLGLTVSLARRHQHHLALLMVDIDHFKRVNDTYGHGAGDLVLVEVAARMSDCLRPGDLLGRWGGEEFLIVLPITGVDGAFEVAERVRQTICSTPIQVAGANFLEITASIGCASAEGEQVDTDRLIRSADKALYAAKEGGRNRVVVASVEGVATPP